MENRKAKFVEQSVPRVVVLSTENELMAGMEVVFEKWGVGATMCGAIPQFMLEIKKNPTPSVIILDLDFLGSATGVSLVTAIRNKFSKDIPLWLIGSQIDPEQLKSLSVNDIQDILVKPIQRSTLVNKISNHVKTADLIEEIESQPSTPLPEGQVIVDVDLEVIEVSESSLKVISSQWLTKGSSVVMNGPLMMEWTGNPLGKLMTVASSEFNPETQKYVMELDFDPDDLALQAQIRKWMLKSR